MRTYLFTLLALVGFSLTTARAQHHPSLLVSADEVATIRKMLGEVPAFDQTIDQLIVAADQALATPMSVPAPKDGGGGVVHEQHKTNYYAMFHCGLAYQYTGNKRYARYVTDMLLEYARLYPTWGLHPMTLSKLRGRLFWQTLNESVWLVHTAMAYDCVAETLTKKQRDTIEKNLLLNMADFIMNGYQDFKTNHDMFNRMHNHATWAAAAVGMTGFATGHQELVNQALYGSDGTGNTGGFLRQMDYLFSPDGYYTEGAYYERYAIWPFMIFAQSISHNMPELKIFERRDHILEKAVNALIQLTYNGEFFHFNDALQKGLSAQELTYAVNILYQAFPEQKQLLTVSRDYQRQLLPTMGGYMIARDIAKGEAQPIVYKSKVFTDGRQGDEGAVAVIRSTRPALNSALTLKATKHGMEHGHFDKLTMAYYDNGHEILADYGAARFLNIEAKYAGHYTRENKTFAKQTIAHNTLVVDGKSNFNAKVSVADQYHSDLLYSDFSNPSQQVVAAQELNAYPGVTYRRYVAYVDQPEADYPLIVDVIDVESAEEHQYDYPLWYCGHFVSTNFPYTKAAAQMQAFGEKNGYQHLWLEAWGQNTESSMSQFTFFNDDRFYTVSTVTTAASEMKFLRLGANDPDFNLRNSSTAYLIREPKARNHTFVSLIETHGEYDLVWETSANLTSQCRSLRITENSDQRIVVEIDYKGQPISVKFDKTKNSKCYEDL
ncbi:MAG: heparinase II/III family protein [Prevotella sp.]|nr:heparinase II/III family protein [Prevotella sp.]